jgi:MFS transporter, NNP family, nitrate/nitrite transporter
MTSVMVDRPESSPSPGAERETATTSPAWPVVLATVSFALSFAAWGLVGGLAGFLSTLYSLSASQTALLVAVPVLLGSLARLPMGMLTDRFGGRAVFTALLVSSSLAVFVVARPPAILLYSSRRS